MDFALGYNSPRDIKNDQDQLAYAIFPNLNHLIIVIVRPI